MTRFFGRPQGAWLISAVVAGGLLLATLLVPLWKMELVAPQYPEGLVMYAYGYKFADDPSSRYDDIREINGLNHYIGMKPIVEVTEMDLYIPGAIALAAAAVGVAFIAWRRRWFQALIVLAFWFFPLFFVADLQYWLYHYGHTMDPEAPLNTGSFTPKVFGTTHVWNFHSETSFGPGFYLLLAAALAITGLPPAIRWVQRRRRAASPARTEAETRPVRVAARTKRVVGAKTLVMALLIGASVLALAHARASAADTPSSLQERVAAAAPGDTVVVDGGVFREQVVIDKPLSLVGRNWPVIDGGGQGDVVTIAADDVTVTGFVIRGTSHSLSQEPAAVKADSVDRVVIKNNRIFDAHFGVHITGSDGSAIEDNVLDIGAHVPVERRGHAIYLWRVTHSVIHGNVVRHAADGIHLEFSEGNGIGANRVTDSRYALHFMYSHRNRIVGNRFENNLAGAVLMFSHDVLLKDNELSGNRRGATGTGLLLKDVDNLFAEGNRLLRNKYGMTAEGTPQSVGATAILQRNLFALNDTGIAVMSNAPITFVENAMIDNTVQVKALGGELASRVLSTHGGGLPASNGASERPAQPPKGAVWTIDGRGNYWSDYRGYDADGDGVGDRPYEPQPPFAGRLERDDDLRVFQFTLAQQAIDLAADLFPLYRYHPVITDTGPLMRPPAGLALEGASGVNTRLLVTGGALLLASVVLGGAIAGVRPRLARGALAGPARPLGGEGPA